MKKARLIALIALSPLLLSASALAQDAGEEVALQRAYAACQAALQQLYAGVEGEEAERVQSAVDRLESLADEPIACAAAPLAIGAAFRLGLAEPGEDEPDAEAHFRHVAASLWLDSRNDDVPPERWASLDSFVEVALAGWPAALRAAVRDGVEGERAWARSIVEGGPAARLAAVTRSYYGIGQAPYPALARSLTHFSLEEDPSTEALRIAGQIDVSPASGDWRKGAGVRGLSIAAENGDGLAANLRGRLSLLEHDYEDAYFYLMLAAGLGAPPVHADIEAAASGLAPERAKDIRRRVASFLLIME